MKTCDVVVSCNAHYMATFVNSLGQSKSQYRRPSQNNAPCFTMH